MSDWDIPISLAVPEQHVTRRDDRPTVGGLRPLFESRSFDRRFDLGHDLRRDRRAVRRQVGMLGHATFLYDELTVADNVAFALRAAGCDARTAPPAPWNAFLAQPCRAPAAVRK